MAKHRPYIADGRNAGRLAGSARGIAVEFKLVIVWRERHTSLQGRCV